MAFRKPATKKLGLKVLLQGKQGSGKTITALTFPRIASIDGEAGQSFYENTDYGKNLLFVDNTQSFKELEDNIEYIEDNYEEEDIQSLVIDSETKVFNNLEETLMVIEEKKARENGRQVDDTNISMRSRGRIKYVAKKLQNLKIDLSSKGVNVVSIAQGKDIKTKQGDSWVTTGMEPDMVKGSEFDYDIVLEHFTDEDVKGKTHYKAKVLKDRTNVYKKGDIIENASYEMWKKVIDSRKDLDSLKTNFVQDTVDTKKAYEEDLVEESKSIVERFATLLKESDVAVKAKIADEMKAAKISSFEGLTDKQQEKLEKIYAKYK